MHSRTGSQGIKQEVAAFTIVTLPDLPPEQAPDFPPLYSIFPQAAPLNSPGGGFGCHRLENDDSGMRVLVRCIDSPTMVAVSAGIAAAVPAPIGEFLNSAE